MMKIRLSLALKRPTAGLLGSLPVRRPWSPRFPRAEEGVADAVAKLPGS